MKINRITTTVFIALSIFFVQCNKGGEDSAGTETKSGSFEAVELTGTPAQNMITVFDLGVKALEKNAENPGAAASELEAIMNAYNIADLREKSKSAKGTDQAATEQEKTQFKQLMETYKSLSVTVGGKDPAKFNDAHSKWSAAWGIN